jgi:peroxiredoxin
MTWSAALLGMALMAPAAMGQMKAGDKPPDVTLKDLSGKTVKLSRLRGSAPAVINFFATY